MYRSPSRGQATIGYALVIGIALIGTVTVVALGATALTDIRTSSETGAAEQAMTQFDSRTSQVALGNSESQSVSVGEAEGSYDVDPDAGHVRVVHVDFAGDSNDDGNDISDGPNDDDQVLYESTLGTVRYQRDDTTVAYQSGGVWRKTGKGQGTMVSPPEFHYRGSTLTFPIIRVNQNSGDVQSGSGSVDLRTTQSDESADIFPTRQDGYPDIDSDNDGFDDDGDGDPYGGSGDDGDSDGGYYDNPASNGTVIIYIQSEYYQAWADYLKERTDGKVDTTDTAGGLVGTGFDVDGDGTDEQNVVAAKLVSTGFTGPFNMPREGSYLDLRGIEDHSLSDFTITLTPDTQDQAQFSNLKWSMYAREGNQLFEMYLRPGSNKSKKCDDGTTDMMADLSIYYSDDGGDTYNGWHGDDVYAAKCEDVDGDGTDEIVLEVDFIDDEDGNDGPHDVESGDPNLTYVDKSGMNGLVQFSIEGDTAPSSVTFDGHSSEASWESRTYSKDTDTETVDRVLNHYLSELGTLDLTVDDKESDTVSESGSSGRIEYIGGDRFITYIHISENDVRVRID